MCIQTDMDSCTTWMAYTSIEWQWFGTQHHHVHSHHHGHPYERAKQGICQDWTKESDGYFCARKCLSLASFNMKTVAQRDGKRGKELAWIDVKASLGPWWSQGLFPSLSQLQINPFIKKSSRAHWKLPKETVWGWSKNKLSFCCYIIWLISANNCVIISHVLRAVIGGQNDEDQVLWFDWVSKPKNIHKCACLCVCISAMHLLQLL